MTDAPRTTRLAPTLAVALAAALAVTVALVWGLVGAPLVSEDTAALGYVHQHGPLADAAQPQYDLRTVRFWRPLVTATLDLQEALGGVDPTWLRAFNLGCHALAAALCGAIARALGGGRSGAVVATAWALGFPFLGGTAHWVVGRVDSQCLPLVLGTGLAALAGRPRTAGWLALAALGTKESGAVAPAVATVLCFGLGLRPREVARRVGWAWAALGLGLVLRRLALGMWVGGYAVEGAPPGAGLAGLGGGLASAAEAGLPWVAAPLLALVLGPVLGLGRPRAALAAAAAGLGCLAPLLPLLSRGALEAVHRRWLLAPDALLGVALALALAPRAAGVGRSPAPVRTALAVGLGLVAAGLRLPEARADLERWAAGGEAAAAVEARVRNALAEAPPSRLVGDRPVLVGAAPRVTDDGRAYVLQWGVADRFRPPFEPAPRPVWPWRPLFPSLERDRDPVGLPVDGLRLPFGEAPPTAPEIPVTVVDGGERLGRDAAVRLDDRLLEDRPLEAAPLLVVEGSYPTPRLEWLLFTELGFGTGLWADPGPAVEPPPGLDLGRPAGGPLRLVPLRAPLLTANDRGLPLYATLRQAADFGARTAYLQLRAVDDERGRRDRPVAASRWIRLEWGDPLRRTMLPR